MAKEKKKSVISYIWFIDSHLSMRVFEIVAVVLAYGAFYFALMSALPSNAGRVCASLVGAVAAAVFMALGSKKIAKLIVLGVAALYTVLCVAAGFNAFSDGLFSIWNSIAYTANNNMHWGLPFASGDFSAGADFLFCSVFSIWLAIAVAAIGLRRRLLLILGSLIVLMVLLCFGLVPDTYAVVWLVTAWVALLMADKGFTIKAAMCYLLCAVVFFAALAPCFLYDGSGAVKGFRSSIVEATQNTVYGSDSLPEGNLKKSYGMRSSEEVMLEVELSSATPTLYLKGFVGGEFKDNVWYATDKNAYVSDGYQGIMDYVAAGGLPFTQYSRYSVLSGNRDKYTIKINNVGANRKYVYAPYTATTYSSGSTYYDLNLRSGIFSSREYDFEIFAGDKSSERVSQSSWVLDPFLRNDEMSGYLELEGEYRSFVKHNYSDVDENTIKLIRTSMGDISINSINTATQIMRTFFMNTYEYSDFPDGLNGGFAAEFFGGNIKKASAPYFATAAVYIFRMYGFAARYAEGYLIRSKGTGEYMFPVTGNNAHAWAEVYFDGIGWLPIEVTPTFFSEEELGAPISPENPNQPSEPIDPVKPPEELDPDDTKDPPEIPVKPIDPERARLLTALKVLVSVTSVSAGAVLIILAIVVRRQLILSGKRKKLAACGEEYGRAAYSIARKESGIAGEITEASMAEVGIEEQSTRRFVQLIEKSVYGAYELSVNEKKFVTTYLERVSDARLKGRGKLNYLICKYIKCIGI